MSHVVLEPRVWADGDRVREWARDPVTRAFLKQLLSGRETASETLRRLGASSNDLSAIRGASVRLETLESIIKAIEEAGKVEDDEQLDSD